MFYKKDVLRNFAKFAGKHQSQRLIFNKVAVLRTATLLKKNLWHRCFPANFAEYIRTPFLTEHIWWLLLNTLPQTGCTIRYDNCNFIKNSQGVSLWIFQNSQGHLFCRTRPAVASEYISKTDCTTRYFTRLISTLSYEQVCKTINISKQTVSLTAHYWGFEFRVWARMAHFKCLSKFNGNVN